MRTSGLSTHVPVAFREHEWMLVVLIPVHNRPIPIRNVVQGAVAPNDAYGLRKRAVERETGDGLRRKGVNTSRFVLLTLVRCAKGQRPDNEELWTGGASAASRIW
jgi:hypothetical protein